MPAPYTTPTVIRADFIQQLKGGNGVAPLVPLTAPWNEALWREVHSVADVPSPELRRFFVEVVPGVPITEGIYGKTGVEREIQILVWTSYGGVPEGIDRCLIEEDSTQLHTVFTRRMAGQLPGLISVEPEPWQDGPDGDDVHYLWGAHPFVCRYVSPASL